MDIYYQPISTVGSINIQESLECPAYSLDEIKGLIPKQQIDAIEKKLRKKGLQGFHIWGITPDEMRAASVSSIRSGDCIFLIENITKSGGGVIRYWGHSLIDTFDSPDLSNAVWESRDYSKIIILNGFSIDLQWASFRGVLGYNENFYTQYFKRYDKEKKWKGDKEWKSVDQYVAYLKNSSESLLEKHGVDSSHVRFRGLVSPTIDSVIVETRELPIGNSETTEQTNKPVAEEIEDTQDTVKLFNEGFEKEIVTNRHERNPIAVSVAKAIHGDTCVVCGFNFGKVYGEHGTGFIEAHHLFPISDGDRHTNPETDITVLCSNCHRMIHRGEKILTVEELKRIIENAKGNSEE